MFFSNNFNCFTEILKYLIHYFICTRVLWTFKLYWNLINGCCLSWTFITSDPKRSKYQRALPHPIIRLHFSHTSGDVFFFRCRSFIFVSKYCFSCRRSFGSQPIGTRPYYLDIVRLILFLADKVLLSSCQRLKLNIMRLIQSHVASLVWST